MTMAQTKNPGPVINGETANAWEGRTRRQLLAPREENGYGLSEREVKNIEKQLDEVKPRGSRKLRPEPPPLALLDQVAALEFDANGENPKEVFLDTLPEGKEDSQYFIQILADGGYDPVRFEAVKLPAGLSVSIRGIVSGQFVNAGPQEITVKAIDMMGDSAEKTFTVNVAQAPGAEETAGVEESETGEAVEESPLERAKRRVGLMQDITPSVAAGLVSSVPQLATGQDAQGQPTANTGESAETPVTPATPVATDTGQAKETSEKVNEADTESATPLSPPAGQAGQTEPSTGRKGAKTGDKTNGGT
jgi:hypothetical protein